MRYLISLLVCATAIAADLGNPSSLAILPPIVSDGSSIASPTNIADLGMWHMPESLEGAPEGTGTNSWLDSTANAFNLLQSSATLRPYLTNNVIDSFRGLYFDGSDDTMTWGDTGALASSRNRPGYTIFAVASRVSADTGRTLFYTSVGTSSTQARMQLRASAADSSLMNGVARRVDTDGASVSDDCAFPAGVFLLCARWDWANGAFKVWTNGVVAINDTTMTSTGNTSDTTAQQERIGGTVSAGIYFGGVFTEFLVYTNTVSDSDCEGLTSGYWSTKYPSLPLP